MLETFNQDNLKIIRKATKRCGIESVSIPFAALHSKIAFNYVLQKISPNSLHTLLYKIDKHNLISMQDVLPIVNSALREIPLYVLKKHNLLDPYYVSEGIIYFIGTNFRRLYIDDRCYIIFINNSPNGFALIDSEARLINLASAALKINPNKIDSFFREGNLIFEIKNK